MKLKNALIRDGIAAIMQLSAIEILDSRATYNLGRTLKYCKAAYEKVEDERLQLVKAVFGEQKDIPADHPKMPEFTERYADLLKEETEVEKVFKVTVEQLSKVRDGTKAIPGTVWEAMEFMLEEPSVEQPSTTGGAK